MMAPGLVETYDMPGPTSGSKRVQIFDPNPYMMGPAFYSPSHASSIPCIGSTSCMREFPVVRLRGLPFNCKGPDIYNFFMGLDIVDCLFVNKKGRFTGKAYVVFSSSLQVHLALQRDHKNMGHMEAFACKKSDYYGAVAAVVNFAGYLSAHKRSPSPELQNKRTRKGLREDKKKSLDEKHFTEVLKLRGLPYSATEADIVKYFGREFELSWEANINICCWVNGKATGEAFAKFSSAEMAKKAMKQDKMFIGSRYVELFPSMPEEWCHASSKCA